MKIFCLIFVFFFLINGFSQSVLSPKFQKIQNQISKSDIADSIILLSNKAFEIGKANKNSNEKGLALLNKSRAHIVKAEYEEAAIFLKKALYWAKKSKNKNLEGLVTLELGKNYQLTSAPDKALYLMLQAKRFFERKNYKQSLV